MVGTVLESIIEGGEALAEKNGLTGLQTALHDAGFAVGAADTFTEEHPVEAAAAFMVGVAVATFLLPEVAAAGATALAETSVMQGAAAVIR